MQAERLEILDRAYEAWNAAEFERWAEQWDEDVVYDLSRIFWDQRPIHGREAMVKWAHSVLRAWESMRLELVETLEVSDERIVQRVRVEAKASYTGLDMDQSALQVFEYAGGPLPVRGWLRPDDWSD